MFVYTDGNFVRNITKRAFLRPSVYMLNMSFG